MQVFLYLTIFILKTIEVSLSTLRLIVVAKEKKITGALLQFLISLIWAISTGLVVINIKEDPLTILFLAFGSCLGSYLGSNLEIKLKKA